MTLVTKPYSVADAEEYVEYHARLAAEADRLQAEGRLPDNEAIESFFRDVRQVVSAVQRDASDARVRGQQEVVTRLPMSPADHRRIFGMNESIRSLLEVLEMRQAVELHRTPAVARVADAVTGGTLEG